ncbi:DUF3024 domain-containing protein [Herbaspirillum sp. HC18]|nr:DUF3024 domain-containing protein [Herbaspirillum sp. HC18]
MAKSGLHPNEVDLKRIARLLEKRERYQYVSPSVRPENGGYRIVSPCCSRNIDQSGGLIDIALIVFDEKSRSWNLFCKDHGRNMWQFHLRAAGLHAVMECLNADSGRVFWQ